MTAADAQGFKGDGLDGVERRGLMFVLSSPSGAGKTTMSRLLMQRMPNMKMSVSVTTRPKRPGEIEGRDYRFIDKASFEDMAKRGDLLEWATVFDNRYGTPRQPVEDALSSGHDVLFDIDWQGTQQLRERARADVVSVFLLPPSVDALEMRLHSRAQDSDEVIHDRMSRAGHEMSHWAEYDYVVVNSDLTEAYEKIEMILQSERLRRERQLWLSSFVRKLQRQLER
jgi:guanylate kinase